jgi:hypothetical protein
MAEAKWRKAAHAGWWLTRERIWAGHPETAPRSGASCLHPSFTGSGMSDYGWYNALVPIEDIPKYLVEMQRLHELVPTAWWFSNGPMHCSWNFNTSDNFPIYCWLYNRFLKW